jgi:hypothetical protein
MDEADWTSTVRSRGADPGAKTDKQSRLELFQSI